MKNLKKLLVCVGIVACALGGRAQIAPSLGEAGKFGLLAGGNLITTYENFCDGKLGAIGNCNC